MAPYSLPAAKPYAFNFDTRRTALVIIDVQKDFVEPNGFGSIQCGSPEIFSGVRNVVSKIVRVLRASRSLGLHVIHTREGHVPDLSDLPTSKRDRQINAPGGHHSLGIGEQGPMGRLLVRGEQGHAIVDELLPLPGEVVIDKSGKGSFWNTGLHRALMARGITHLLFCGVTTECCVTTTVREANDRGFECCILSDCTSGFNSNFVQTSLNMISAYDGLFGYTACSQSLLALENYQAQLTPPLTPPIGDAPTRNPMGLTSIRQQYEQGQLDLIALVHALYDKIEESEATSPHVWIHLRSRSELIADARMLTSKYAGKPFPELYGIPFAVKDNFDVAGLPTTAACSAYTYTPTTTAPSVQALLSAGALLIGKTNMDQFATGLSGCRSPYGTPASVYGANKHISGGSSSGSGVAVGAQFVTFSLGTDTAGSGRVPAAFNGIVGFKPTTGTISARGVVPACKSLDTVSVFASNVPDARSVWHVLDGYDSQDPYAKLLALLPLRAVDYRGVESAGFAFTIPPPSALSACSPTFTTLFSDSVSQLERLGGRYTPLSEEEYEPFRTATRLLYSGTLVNERISCIGSAFISQHLEPFHPTTRSLFEAILNRESKPWDVFTDQIAQRECTRQAARLFEKIDVMVLPTVPFHPTIKEMEADPIALNAKVGEYTHFANVLDLSAISINTGFYEGPNGRMPFGISVVGGMGMDGRLFDIADYIEEHLNRK